MHAVTPQQLEQASEKIAAEVVRESGADVPSVALDMTNFATFIATANTKAPIAQRGKAKQHRADLRLVGLGLVVTRDGGIPLTWHAFPGDRPDVTQFLLRSAGTRAGTRHARSRTATIPRDLITMPARVARRGRGDLILHLPQGHHREQAWLNLWADACGPPAAAA